MPRILAVLAALLVAAPALTAQSALTVSAGAALPVGGTAGEYERGVHGMVAFDAKVPIGPFGMRFEGVYSQMGAKGAADVARRVIAGIGSLTLSGGSMYVIGGLGFYNWGCSGSGCPAASQFANDLGANAGLGYVIPFFGLATVVEARVHVLLNNSDRSTFVPLTFGISF
jgi:hypothetical protein